MQKNPKLKRKGPKPSLTAARTFYIDIEDIERLVSYSNQLEVSASRIVREALKKTLDEMEETGEVSPIQKNWGVVEI